MIRIIEEIRNIKIKSILKNIFFLFFITFELFFQKNSNIDFLFLTSIENLLFILLIIILYFISKQVRIRYNKLFIFFFFILIFLIFFNALVELSLLFLQNNIRLHVTYLQVLIIYFFLVACITFLLRLEILYEILNRYFIISILYFSLSIIFQKLIPIKVKNDLKNDTCVLFNSSVKKSILLIVLDEYSPVSEIISLTENPNIHLLEDFLIKKNFFTTSIETSEASTIRSMNKIFNYRYMNSFSESNIDNIKYNLYNTNFICDLEKKGYNFVNYSFIDFKKYKSKYNFDPYENSKQIQIIKFTIFKLFFDRIFENKFENLGYNKFVLNESNKFLQKPTSWNNNFIYLHLLMPHGPFYHTNNFDYKTRNLNNYIEFREFTSKIMINYLTSIDLSKFNIFIISDHGFRSSSRVNPYISFFSCSNCDFKNERLTSLNDFHNLILN